MNETAPCADKTGGLWRLVQTNIAFQILLLLLLWQAGEAIARLTHLPIPGSVIAMGLLLMLLSQKILHPATLQRGARWFLAEMVLFLLPSVISLLAHPELFGRTGLKLLAAILLGTLAVMLVTALVVETCHRWLLLPDVTASEREFSDQLLSLRSNIREPSGVDLVQHRRCQNGGASVLASRERRHAGDFKSSPQFKTRETKQVLSLGERI